MAAAVMGAEAATAGSKSDEWKRRTLEPSVLVPSGKSKTGTGSWRRSVIWRATSAVLARLLRSMNIVAPVRAALPKKGQRAISDLETKKQGMTALRMAISR